MTALEQLVADLRALHIQAGRLRGQKDYAEAQLRKVTNASLVLQEILEQHVKFGFDIDRTRAAASGRGID